MRVRRSFLLDPSGQRLSDRVLVVALVALAALVMLAVAATDLGHLLLGSPADPIP